MAGAMNPCALRVMVMEEADATASRIKAYAKHEQGLPPRDTPFDPPDHSGDRHQFVEIGNGAQGHGASVPMSGGGGREWRHYGS